MTVAFEAGFSLAALLHGDAELTAVRAALAPGLQERVERYAEAVRSALAVEREKTLRRVAADARELAVRGGLEPRRVLAVIATEVSRDKGAAWIAAVPRHRPGWSASSALRTALLRHAGPSVDERAAAEMAELDAAWPA